eukprot:7591831-Pyramimonas_sp.AAC.1
MPGKRFLICVIKKSDLCACGCQGWCTIGCVHRILTWSFTTLSKGVWPSFDHNGEPLDEMRSTHRGFQLAGGKCGALCEYRADLLEIVTSL